MNGINPTTLEVVLKANNKTLEVSKILEITAEPAVVSNQNFLSTVKRLRAKVILKNGRVANRTFILKDSYTEGESFKSFIRENNVFEIETLMYTIVLKELENLMEDFEDEDSILWCKMLHYKPYSSLLLEDLQGLGFKALTTPCYLDLEHAFLVLHYIGKYHGMCKGLEERGAITIAKDWCKEWFVLSNRKTCQVWKECLARISVIIRQFWSISWNHVAEGLGKLSLEAIEDKINETKYLLDKKFPFKLLNHGDLKISNIMFKYDWRHRPIGLRFLDFQLPTYSSPCVDLSYFLYRALDPLTRRSNFDQLLSCYYDSLVSTLQKYNYTGLQPSLKDISAEMKLVSYLGQLLCIINYIPIRDQQDTESETASEFTMQQIIDIYKKPGIETELGQDVQELIEKLN